VPASGDNEDDCGEHSCCGQASGRKASATPSSDFLKTVEIYKTSIQKIKNIFLKMFASILNILRLSIEIVLFHLTVSKRFVFLPPSNLVAF
jgi:hypothetical protein